LSDFDEVQLTVNGPAIYYYAEDFLGSSRAMVQSGTTSPCFDADFLPFGREKDAVATCTQNDYKFEGKERDTETGNDDFGARYYSSNFGRWLSPDWSSIPEPVPYANLTNPQTLNLYAMVQDNPESFADLDGHWNTPASADKNNICNVTGLFGCDEKQQALLWYFDAHGDYTPQGAAAYVNLNSQGGEPYALTSTPTISVGKCLADVAACQKQAEDDYDGASAARREAAWLKVGADFLALASLFDDGETTPWVEQVEGKVGGLEDEAAADAERTSSKIDRNAFKSEREAYWKAEAQNNPSKYSAEDLARMRKGLAPIGPDGHSMELHHVDRTPEGGVEPMSRTDHRLGGNYKKNHP
jgi:RHS repeat-associated protein